jgi:beta-lactam-binding protein with PASTA domain
VERPPGRVSVFINSPGRCTVQPVLWIGLAAAKRTTIRAKCRVGTIRRAYSRFGAKGTVVAQKPRFGAVLPKGGKVNLVLSRGRKG